MAQEGFKITKKIKYDKEWDYPETQAWMEKTKDIMRNEFTNLKESYKRYNKCDFATLEEYIAISIFGISEEFAQRAFEGESLLPHFSREERQQAMKIRKRLEEVTDKTKNTIDVKVIPIALRMDDDVKRDKEDDEDDEIERQKKEAKKITGRAFVFRLALIDSPDKFVDCETRVYKSWKAYLRNNQLPQCIMCYPQKGVLGNNNGETFIPNEVAFCEPKACTKFNRMRTLTDKVVMIAMPVITIGSICCPTTWVIAPFLTATSTTLFGYGIATQGYQLVDQIRHGKDYAVALIDYMMSIGSILITKGLNKYARMVDNMHREFCTLESVLITGTLLGLTGTRLVSFGLLTWNIVTKPEWDPIDIIGYVVACHSLYSVVVSPKTAGQLLKKVKLEIQAEHLQRIKEDKTQLNKQKTKIENHRKDLEGTCGADKAKIEKGIKQAQKKVDKIEERILKSQNGYLDNVKGWMKNDAPKEKFDNLRKSAVKDKETSSRSAQIHGNDRVIETVVNMDAEKIFTLVAEGKLKVQLITGETMDVSNSAEPTTQGGTEATKLDAKSGCDSSDKKEDTMTKTGKKVITTILSVATIGKPLVDRAYRMTQEEGVVRDCVYIPVRDRLNEMARQKRSQREERMAREGAGNAPPPPSNASAANEQPDNGTPCAGGGHGNSSPDPSATNAGSTTGRFAQLGTKMAEAYGDNSLVCVNAWTEIAKMDYEDFQKPDDPPITRDRMKEYHEELRKWETHGLMKDGEPLARAKTLADENFRKRESVEDAKAAGKDATEIERLTTLIDNSSKIVQYHQKNFAAWNSRGSKEDIFFDQLLNPDHPEAFDIEMERHLTEIEQIQEHVEGEAGAWSHPVSAYYHLKILERARARNNQSQNNANTPGASSENGQQRRHETAV